MLEEPIVRCYRYVFYQSYGSDSKIGKTESYARAFQQRRRPSERGRCVLGERSNLYVPQYSKEVRQVVYFPSAFGHPLYPVAQFGRSNGCDRKVAQAAHRHNLGDYDGSFLNEIAYGVGV